MPSTAPHNLVLLEDDQSPGLVTLEDNPSGSSRQRIRSGSVPGDAGALVGGSTDDGVGDGGRYQPPKFSLDVKTLVAYGWGEFGLYVAGVVQGFFLLEFLLETASVSPYATSVIMLVMQVFDALSDPLVGMISDRTGIVSGIFRGRRRPWLIFGAFPFAIFWYLQWQVPSTSLVSVGSRAWYYLFTTLGLSLGYTVCAIPYAAATPELAPSYDDRTKLTASRFIGGLTAGVLATFAFAQLQLFYVDSTDPVRVEEEYQKGYALAAGVTAPVVFLGPLVCGLVIRERMFEDPVQRLALKSQAKTFREISKGWLSLLRNRAYVLLLLTYCCSWLVLNFIQSNFVLYNKFVLRLEYHTPYFMVVVQAGSALMLVPASYLSRWIGKKLTFVAGLATLAVTIGAAYFVQPGQVVAMYIAFAIASFGLAIAVLIPWSMLPDVVDLDEVNTGHRREGELVSLFMILQKVGLGLALAISSAVLGWAGYENPDQQAALNEDTNTQPESVIWALRIMMTVVPPGLIVAALVLIYFYPLGKKEVEEIQEKLAERRGASAPLVTGSTPTSYGATHDTILA